MVVTLKRIEALWTESADTVAAHSWPCSHPTKYLEKRKCVEKSADTVTAHSWLCSNPGKYLDKIT